MAVEAIRDTAMGAATLPDDMRRYLAKAYRGELEVRVRGLQESADPLRCRWGSHRDTAIGLFGGGGSARFVAAR